MSNEIAEAEIAEAEITQADIARWDSARRGNAAAALTLGTEQLRRDGWIQGAMFNRPAMCLVGALDYVTRCEGDQSQCAYGDARTAFKACHGIASIAEEVSDGIPEWNDFPGRTIEDVTNAMEKAALWLEEMA